MRGGGELALLIERAAKRCSIERWSAEGHLTPSRPVKSRAPIRYDGVLDARGGVGDHEAAVQASSVLGRPLEAHLAGNTIRFATDRLTALAQDKGAVERPVPEALFVSEQNAGRSQMAAAVISALSGGAVHVRSAGSAPAHELNAAVGRAMAEH